MAVGGTRPVTLRPQQVKLLAEIDRVLAAGCTRIIAQMPTGGGKTMVASVIADKMMKAGKRMIFSVPALSLIDQTVEKFRAEGISKIGVMQANHRLTNPDRPIQIVSVQTLQRRDMPPADMVVLDEVHRWFDAYAEWLEGPWANIPVIGLAGLSSPREMST